MLPPRDNALCADGCQPPAAWHAPGCEEEHPRTLPALGQSWAIAWHQTPTSITAFRQFLLTYRDTLLLPVELPAILRSFQHVARYEIREMLHYDRHLADSRAAEHFAFASQAVGRRYLRRLRPLRDVRWIRRYHEAIERQQAYGWHTLVYGAVLTVYSLPLRQGLLGYARQTLGGFVSAAGSSLRWNHASRSELLEESWQGVPAAVNLLLPSGSTPIPGS